MLPKQFLRYAPQILLTLFVIKGFLYDNYWELLQGFDFKVTLVCSLWFVMLILLVLKMRKRNS